MTKSTLILLKLAVITIFSLGAIAGHFHGKSVVYEALFNKSDYMTINPVAVEKMK